MDNDTRITEVAEFLFQEHRRRTRFTPLPPEIAPHTVEEAYAVQEALVTLNSAAHGAVAGYKIGMTTPVMQQMVGLNEPAAGVILAALVHHSPHTLARADFVRLGIECEIAVRLGADLPAANAPYSRRRLFAAIDAVMPAFELVEDRNADYALLPGQAISLICDNAWNAGVVLGAPISDWHEIDLAAVRGRLFINGETVGEGRGSDVMGHPVESLVWLANLFARQGKNLMAGEILMTGSIIPTKFVGAGSDVRFTTDDLGEVRLRVN